MVTVAPVNLLRWIPATLLPLLWSAAGDRKSRRSWLFLLSSILVLSMISHKQLRYLQPVVPFLCILAAIGAAIWWSRSRRHRIAVVGLVLLASLWSYRAVEVLGRGPMSATLAAKALAPQLSPADTLVLSQSWAYGGRLYLGTEIDLRDLPTPPTVAELAAELVAADWVSLYEEDLEARPGLSTVLDRNGFREVRRYSSGASRSVVVFTRSRATPRSGTESTRSDQTYRASAASTAAG